MTLGLQKATNARDLGGLSTTDGRRIRTGVLFRANALHNLSDADVGVLDELKLACVIDFRDEVEVTRVGVDRLPAGPRLISLPVLDKTHNMDVFAVIADVARGRTDASELDFLREEAPGGGAPAMMATIYRQFVTSETSRASFAEALRLIAEPDNLPLLFHCTAGKDRTGWLAALVLTILDVDHDTILADYLRTNDLSTGTLELILTVLDGKIPDPKVIVPMVQARAAYLEAAFEQAERSCGGINGYLRDGLGVDDAALTSIRANLLE
jgi:protein-tyrosine phosphatase